MLFADPCLGLCVSVQRQGLPPARERAGCGAWRYTDELDFSSEATQGGLFQRLRLRFRLLLRRQLSCF